MTTTKKKENDSTLPFPALQLLAPPVRLVSAAVWKVMKQRDVMHYGTVEEFVTSACDGVPGLLTLRHQGRLTLGLRARLILELCSKQPDAELIQPHLERIRAPVVPSTSSACPVTEDVKIMKTVSSFHEFVQTLLTDPDERERFFQEEFLVDYGPTFDQELEKLLWEFLVRLDQLLPVPNLKQTVSWLSTAPAVLEECAQVATQPQLLKTLLEHESCLGHLSSAASLPPNLGESILSSLSLPLSGRVASDKPSGSGGQPDASGHMRDTSSHKAPFITPVFGLMSNEDVPVMNLVNKNALMGGDAASLKNETNVPLKNNLKFPAVKRRRSADEVKVAEPGQLEETLSVLGCGGTMKRTQPCTENESEEGGEGVATSARRRISRSLISESCTLSQSQNVTKSKVQTVDEEVDALTSHLNRLGVKTLRLPEDPSLHSVFQCCLLNQPRVVVDRLQMTSTSSDGTSVRGTSSHVCSQNQRRASPVRARTNGKPEKLRLDFGLNDKENHCELQNLNGSSHQRINSAVSVVSGDVEDYVADSEDEATKNFKGRLFQRRYYKTKYGTYVPTLREFWKPAMVRRNLTSDNKHR
ncbi:uncharacterized protein tinf2 isoform X2 [Thalassophryne amazonica]|uniref:uncharacterized protein tinf2 isoform X2 n=1 Tax=Thalassophryne amazonica TaxID=390379 RepID=UPI001472533A|nr:uncharacterized protein tinf2 isoform X2 [Thalassophryne amazonica]